MLCQACEKHETSTAVICESCVSHYASIREGQYQEREFVVAEHRYALRSWIDLPSPTHKRATRDEKAAKKGFFGKKAPPEAAAPAEEAPPPDWKNRVFPLPDPPAAPVVAAVAPAPPVAAPEPLPVVPEPVTHDEPEAMAFTAPVEAEPVELVLAPEPAQALEETVPQLVAPTPEPAEAPPVAVSDFLAALNQPAEPPSAPQEVPEPVAPPHLASFFQELAQPAPVEAPAAPEAPETPAPVSADLSSFFASLATPAPVEPAEPPKEAPAPMERVPEPAFEVARGAVTSEPAPEIAQVAVAPESDLSHFFETLTQSASQPAPPASEPEPIALEAPAPAFEPPAIAPEPAPAAGAELAGFFDSLANAATVPRQPEPSGPVSQPFSFEFAVPSAAADAPASSRDMKPPTHGQPFSIDLTPPPPAAQPRVNAEAAELKRQLSSTGGLSFSDDEGDEDPSHGGLLSGLSFSAGAPSASGFSIVRDDDEDEERTIEL